MVNSEGVVVIGGGQAGLAISHELSGLGVRHVVLERGRVGQTWRDRWDSFCLVTPNWTVNLPGHPYPGAEPDGYMARDEIVDYLESYAASFQAPVREGVSVLELSGLEGGGFRINTSDGEIHAATVVVANGAYQRPHRPAAAAGLPPGAHVIDAAGYTNPDALPAGGVLVVGSGQTGCQLAEEIFESGREVFLACGRSPWMPRRMGDQDTFRWLADTPFFEQPVGALPSPQARLGANPQASGHGGGHDLHFRTLQALGIQLVGRFEGADADFAYFADDLAESVAFGDALYRNMRELILGSCATRGVSAPQLPDPPPFDATPPVRIALAGIGAIIFTAGFRPGYSSWVRFPAFDDMGFPVHHEGASTIVPGLYFMGVHFLRKRKSSLLMGVGEDATIVAASIARRLAKGPGGP